MIQNATIHSLRNAVIGSMLLVVRSKAWKSGFPLYQSSTHVEPIQLHAHLNPRDEFRPPYRSQIHEHKKLAALSFSTPKQTPPANAAGSQSTI